MSTATSVVHVTWSAEIGGIERLVRDLAAEQARNGIAVAVALGQARGPFAGRLRDEGISVVDLDFGSGWDVRPRHIARTANLLSAADVVHLHGFNLSLAAAAKDAHRPIVFTEHGNFALGRVIGHREGIKRHLQGRFLRRSVAKIAANSQHTADRLSELYGVNRSSIEVIHNGLDPSWLERDAAARRAGPNGVLRAATVGRLVTFKRIDRAIEALARTKGRDRIDLAIVGGGPLEETLRSQAVSLGLADRVRFLGDRVDVAETLANTDVLVHPSQKEPFGLVVLEACSQGALPVVFRDGGGVLEVIPPDGLVVGNVGQLASCLDELRGSSALGVDARQRRAAWAGEHFPISRTAAGYADLYQRAVEA